MSSSACSLTWVRVWRHKVVGICYCCWKKLTCYSFSVSNGFYWLTVLSSFPLARLNWQCLKYYSVSEFGGFLKKKIFFPFPKSIVSQCGFWTARLGTRVAKQSKECMFTNRDRQKDGQHMVRRRLSAWMRIQQTEECLLFQ